MGRFWRWFWLAASASLLVSARARAQSPALAPSLTGEREHGRFEVALHARSLQASARAERAAWLSVTLPLDALAAPRVAQQVLVPAPAAPTASTLTPAASSPPAKASPSTAAPAPAIALEPPSSLVSSAQLRALSDFARRATSTALAVAGTSAERRRLDSLTARARGSALLPELRLRAARNTDQALRLSPTTDDPYRVTQADGAGVVLEASATFRLDRLLFAREELTVERLRQQAGEARLKIEARVQAALLGLFRARQLSCFGERVDQKLLELVKVVELFAELDNLTAGWFSAQAADFSRAVWGFPEAVLGVCSPVELASPASATNPVASLENSE